MSQPTVLAVDGNSLLHRAFHASARSGFRLDGRPAWAVRGLLSQLVAAVDRVCADAVVVGFDDRGNSSRKRRWPTYKAHRVPKPETLESQLDLAVDVLRALGVVVVVPPGLEADDVLASVAAQAPTLGARTVVATSDRDSFSLIDEHTRMLRILNGGVDASPLLDPARLAMVTGVRPEQYSDLAALRGDASDNLPGVSGFGAKTAVRLLTELDSAEAAFADALAGGRALPCGRRGRAGQDPGDRGGQGALRPQPRGDGDGGHRRARPGPDTGCRRGRAPARRGDGALGVRPLRAARPRRDPGAHPQGAHPDRRADLRRPAVVGTAGAAVRPAAAARAQRPGVRPGDVFCKPGDAREADGHRARSGVRRYGEPMLERGRMVAVPHAAWLVTELRNLLDHRLLRFPVTDDQGRRIVAVVVTYNRLALLQRLVTRLTAVPQLDEVLVVDNASTDGTGSWLEDAPVSSRTLPTNSGGAGGFHEGLAWAVERGADLVWLMDDDGLPDEDCLARLLEHADLDFWGPVVVDEGDPDRLVFPIRLAGGTRTVRQLDGGPGRGVRRADPRRGHPVQRRPRDA